MNNALISIRSAVCYLLSWLVVIALFMTALPVVAQGPDEQKGEPLPDETAKRATQVQGGGQPVPAEVGSQAIIPEGFEAGVIPPSDWTHLQTNPNETWQIVTYDPHSGSYHAHVLHDTALLNQDEVLLSPTFTANSGSVSLWSFGSLYWCRDNYDNCDLEVWFVNGAWGGGDDLYLGQVDDDWTDTWVWSYSTFDFSAYASGNPARIALRYVGNDGAEVSVDDIAINYFNIGPLVYDSQTVDDDNSGNSSGNNDGIVEPGETIELWVDLYNQGSDTATGVNACISTSDPYVTWLYNTCGSYPDIPGGGTGTNTDDFDFAVDPSTPIGHVIHFDLDITASNGGPWSDSFEVPVGVAEIPPSGIYLPIILNDYDFFNGDDDGDGLRNGWELYGYDADGDGTIDVNLPALGASYRHKDIFVEMDYMVRASATNGLAPNQAVLDAIVAAFNDAPVSNPDGVDGIKIHLELDDEVPYDDDLNPAYSQFIALKNTYFDPKRTAVYHYMIWANKYSGGTSSGLSFGIPATDFIVTLGGWNDNAGGTDYQKIGTFIHELGHNLGLTHGGNDHVNYKPNYISVMNYRFQTWGVYRNGSWYNFDYQRFSLPSLNETSLNEPVGLNGGSVLVGYGTIHNCPDGSGWIDWDASGPIDWNCDGDTNDTGIAVDVNYDESMSTLGSQNNWANIVFDGGGVIGSGLPPQALVAQIESTYVDPMLEELTYEQQLEIDRLFKESPSP